MLARVLEDGKIVATTDPAAIRAALEIHPLTIEDIYRDRDRDLLPQEGLHRIDSGRPRTRR